MSKIQINNNKIFSQINKSNNNMNRIKCNYKNNRKSNNNNNNNNINHYK